LLVLLVTTAALGLLPLLGHQTIIVVQRWVTFLLLPVFLGLAVSAWPHIDFHATGRSIGSAGFSIAIVVVMAAGGLTWANTGSDYTRYLPVDSARLTILTAVSLGGFLPTVALEVLGAAVATTTTGASDPITGMAGVIPAILLVPYLVVVSTTTMLSQSIDLYSSGLSLQALGLRLHRAVCVCIDLVLAGSIGAVALFNDGFNRLYGSFLSLVVIWMAPWAAIYLIDWLLRRGRYDIRGLLADRGGPYWGHRGYRLAGVIAQCLGIVGALAFVHAPFLEGPGSAAVGGMDLSIPVGFAVATATYLAIAGRTVMLEGRRASL
jgi:purine-cytosine permease-like protein